MDDRDLDIFTKNDPEAHKRYLKSKRRKKRKKRLRYAKRFWNPISKAIVWIGSVICAAAALSQLMNCQ